MPKAPTTFDDLRNAVRTDREALTLAVVLPNLPEDERIVDLRGYYDKYADDVFFESDDRAIEDLRRYETPVVPGSDLYRVRLKWVGGDRDDDGSWFEGIEPVPHGRRTYAIDYRDLVEFVSVDAEDAEYEDAPYHTLSDFGTGSPYFRPPARRADGGEVFDRRPHLPV